MSVAVSIANALRATHGCNRRGRRTSEYATWAVMLQRCNNPRNKKFPRYGARGITVCERWQSFSNFLADMGPRPTTGHSLDRIDNNGNYEPGNCRWATRSEQQRNTSTNHSVTFQGETLCLTAWAERTGISFSALKCRFRNGWSAEKALTTPYRQRQPG